MNSLRGSAGSSTTALAAMLHHLFAAEALEEVRRAIAHGSHVLAMHDTVTIREFSPGGALETTFRRGAPLDHEATVIERNLRQIAVTTGSTKTTLDLFDDEETEALAASYRLRQGLCLVRPLTAYGTAVGVIAFHFADRATLPDFEFDSLRKFMDSAGIALYNARLRAGLYDLAFTDPLTGLPNRRRLDEALGKLRGTEASIVLIDFDGLKQVNDSLDYDRGDALISLIGTSLQKSLREGELAVRLGGDEFVVLLPDTQPRLARVRADEIGAAFDGLDVPEDIKPYFRGASVGSATADPDEDLQRVLRRATEEMHARKRRRKTDVRDSNTSESPSHHSA
jgi:diguanylate cyclase (GGDEF)-like protein